MSQICDKRNEVKFLFGWCTATSLKTENVILRAKRCTNMYMADIDLVLKCKLTCLSAQSENA